MFDIFFEVFILGMAVFIFCYPKYILGYKMHLSMLRLKNPKTKLSVKESWTYAVPFVNNGRIGGLVGMKYWKKVNFILLIFLVTMYLLTTILSFFIANIPPYFFIGVNYVYWVALALPYIADGVFVFLLCRLFEKRGLAILGLLVPPFAALLLCYQVPHYFKSNKDMLSGAFEVR